MRAFHIAVLAVVLTLISHLASADGLLYKLPKDGTWATYQVAGQDDKGEVQMKGSFRIASVGRITEDGLPCRWIELVLEARFEGVHVPKPSKETFKVLIPEKFLAKGEKPLEHAIRAWRRVEGGKPEAMKDPKAPEGPMPIVLSGPLKDVKQLDKAEVESKLGRVACEGLAGTMDVQGPDARREQIAVETRLHPDAPFGVVTARWTFPIMQIVTGEKGGPSRATQIGTMVTDLKLTDCGENANSEMPEAK